MNPSMVPTESPLQGPLLLVVGQQSGVEVLQQLAGGLALGGTAVALPDQYAAVVVEHREGRGAGDIALLDLHPQGGVGLPGKNGVAVAVGLALQPVSFDRGV